MYGTQNTAQDEKTRGWIFEERQWKKQLAQMWQMKATATNTRPGSMEEEPDMENKQGDNPSQHKMRSWRTSALREQGQSSGTLTNEQNTNKQKNHSNKRMTKHAHGDNPRQARRVGKQTHNRWTKMQGEYKETIQDNLQRITQQTKKGDKPKGNKQSNNNFMVPHAQ